MTINQSDLRKQAEEKAARLSETSGAESSEDMLHMFHELRVHQIELEMQNEELRQTQKELAAARERYFDLYDLAPAGYFTLSKQGLILEANLTASSMLGVTRGTLGKQPLSRYIFKEDQDPYYLFRNNTFETSEAQRCELRMIKSDGTLFWARLNATFSFDSHADLDMNTVTEPVCRVVMIDITEQKVTESLRIKNLVFDESLTANTITDRNGTITEINARFLSLWGYTDKREVIGNPIFNFLVDPQETTSLLAALDQSGQWEGDLTAIRKDGSTFAGHGLATIIRNKDGIKLGYQSAIMDITKRLQDESDLLQTQKLKSVGTLAGGIAHDFNNILMGLYGNISLAKHELETSHPALQPLANAEKSLSRATRLTKQLLTFAKGGEPVKENVCLKTLVEEVVLFDLTGSNIKFAFKSAPNLWTAKVDKGQIQQVISNLTINAREAMPNGGHLTITLENQEVITSPSPDLHPGKFLKVTVQDEGSGIDPKIRGRIFDPYFTTKQSGSGLGLASTYSIVRKHGGHIDVMSELGKGASFIVYLPASESSELPKTEPSTQSSTRLNSGPRILILDDEEYILIVIPHWLKRLGCIAKTAANGQEAIDLYKRALEAGTPYDVLILDLTIPGGMGGLDALKEILALDPNVNAIVSSGYADSPIMANFAKYGFKGVLAKPYTESQLQSMIGQIMK